VPVWGSQFLSFNQGNLPKVDRTQAGGPFSNTSWGKLGAQERRKLMGRITEIGSCLGIGLVFMWLGLLPLPAAAQGGGQVMMEKPPAAEEK